VALAAAEIGENISVFFGGQLLYTLRKQTESRHEFLDECYAHGLMDGEAFDVAGQYIERVEEFVLV